MTDYQQDEWYEDDEIDWDALWERLYADLDGEALCFRCGYPLQQGKCVNPYCTENPAFDQGDDDHGPA